jgi:hypothetical protein
MRNDADGPRRLRRTVSGQASATVRSYSMKQRFWTLTLLAAVFVGSLAITLITDPETAAHKIAQYPALGALLGVLWKILQDEIRDQRDIKKAATLALNSLFAGAHYASRVYDKQVEFCEGYWHFVLEIIKEMERKAESPILVQKANALYTYRMEQAIWLMCISLPVPTDLRSFGTVSTVALCRRPSIWKPRLSAI